MRLLFAILLAVSVLSAVVHGWSKDDYEIFDLVSDLEAAEGKGTNFYSHLNIDSSASTAEINKAYRKKSLALHPDKNPGVKDIQARFARLGVISQILRSPEKRERYNFFYKNGVPTWRGTGYYYSRFRPTLTHTLLFLVFLTSLFHLLVLKLNFNKDRRRVDYFHREALKLFKNKAGKVEKVDESMGGSGVGRRVRVNMTEGGSHEYTGAGTLELVVVDDKVFLPHDDEGYYTPLSDLATPPSYFRTWPFLAVFSGLRRITPFLPPSVLDSIPESLRPHEHQDNTAPAEKVSDTVDSYDPSAPLSKKDRKASRRSIPNTPKDSPATTDLETDGDDDEFADGTETEAGENGKGKKKKGLGKSGAARRRKMAMKK